MEAIKQMEQALENVLRRREKEQREFDRIGQMKFGQMCEYFGWSDKKMLEVLKDPNCLIQKNKHAKGFYSFKSIQRELYRQYDNKTI